MVVVVRPGSHTLPPQFRRRLWSALSTFGRMGADCVPPCRDHRAVPDVNVNTRGCGCSSNPLPRLYQLPNEAAANNLLLTIDLAGAG